MQCTQVIAMNSDAEFNHYWIHTEQSNDNG